MNDTEFEAQKARVQALIEIWPNRVGLRQWHLRFLFERDYKPDTTNDPVWRLSTRFDVVPEWEYQQATIRCWLPDIEPLSDEDLECSFIHELCHCLVNEMREPDKTLKHEERVVTTITNAIIWAYQDGVEAGSKQAISSVPSAEDQTLDDGSPPR